MKGNELISAVKNILVHYDLSYKYTPKFIKKSEEYPDAILGIYFASNKEPIMVVYPKGDKFFYEYEVFVQGRMYYNDMSGIPDSYDMVEYRDENKKAVLFDSVSSAVDSYCSMIVNEEENERMLNDVEEFFNEEEY